ncbi:hypothetical protein ES703_95051 [subsurface metagenome]
MDKKMPSNAIFFDMAENLSEAIRGIVELIKVEGPVHAYEELTVDLYLTD